MAVTTTLVWPQEIAYKSLLMKISHVFKLKAFSMPVRFHDAGKCHTGSWEREGMNNFAQL